MEDGTDVRALESTPATLPEELTVTSPDCCSTSDKESLFGSCSVEPFDATEE